LLSLLIQWPHSLGPQQISSAEQRAPPQRGAPPAPEIPTLPPLGAPALEVVPAAPADPEPGLEFVPLHAPIQRINAQIAGVTVPIENLTLEPAMQISFASTSNVKNDPSTLPNAYPEMLTAFTATGPLNLLRGASASLTAVPHRK
jgi:hypothetical protein